jgi:hypothetical protein
MPLKQSENSSMESNETNPEAIENNRNSTIHHSSLSSRLFLMRMIQMKKTIWRKDWRYQIHADNHNDITHYESRPKDTNNLHSIHSPMTQSSFGSFLGHPIARMCPEPTHSRRSSFCRTGCTILIWGLHSRSLWRLWNRRSHSKCLVSIWQSAWNARTEFDACSR